ncbi:Zinc finger MYM-type protein 1-like [Oopsacas minuta]|uniref:Zinc finger MYM-type protein 1-like n=1 Tax=Oopsacas minuta TaxID=111878 RepID=A0AAV7JER6_9METZ|nr:Zinc finger MYM-type protein 1-like [Oopsacas minuta]
MHPIHKSGATKRKERHLREEQQIQETSKLPKLDTFFNLQSQSQESPAEGYELLLQHPLLYLLAIHLNKGYHQYCSKSFFTRIHPLTGEFTELIWHCYSPSRGKVFCFACKLLSPTTSLFTQGFNDWKHADERISSHENSQQHREAMGSPVERERRSHWVSKNGNYLGVMEVLSNYDSFLDQHITMFVNKGRGHTSYLSSTICEELISLMGSKVLDTITKELKSAKFYSVSADSTSDVTHSDQLTFIVLCVLPTGPKEIFLKFLPTGPKEIFLKFLPTGPKEIFLKFLPTIGHTGQVIAEMILSFLEEYGIDINNCRGQTYDDASNMSGKYIGV